MFLFHLRFLVGNESKKGRFRISNDPCYWSDHQIVSRYPKCNRTTARYLYWYWVSIFFCFRSSIKLNIRDILYASRFEATFSNQTVILSFKSSTGKSEAHNVLSSQLKITRKNDRMEIIVWFNSLYSIFTISHSTVNGSTLVVTWHMRQSTSKW